MSAPVSPAFSISCASCRAAVASAPSNFALSCAASPGAAATARLADRRSIVPIARPGEAACPPNVRSDLVLLIEIALDKTLQRHDGSLGIRTVGPEEDRRALPQLEAHDAHDALRIDPVLDAVAAHADLALKALRQLGQLDRRPRMQPNLMGDDDRCFGGRGDVH